MKYKLCYELLSLFHEWNTSTIQNCQCNGTYNSFELQDCIQKMSIALMHTKVVNCTSTHETQKYKSVYKNCQMQ